MFGHRLDRRVLDLAQRAAGLCQQTGKRHDGRAKLADKRMIPVAGRDRTGRDQRIDSTSTDLVGPRQHADRVNHRRLPRGRVAEGLEEMDIRRMEVPEQVDDRVGGGWLVLRRQERRAA